MAVPETAETKRRDGRQGRAYTSNPTTIYILLHNAAPHIYIYIYIYIIIYQRVGRLSM